MSVVPHHREFIERGQEQVETNSLLMRLVLHRLVHPLQKGEPCHSPQLGLHKTLLCSLGSSVL